MVRWMSAAVIAADWIYWTPASGVRAHIDLAGAVHARCSKGTNLAGAVPARHVIEVQLHELPRRRHRLFLVAQFEDRVTADHFLGLDERPVDYAELAVGDAHLRTHRDRHQPAAVDHATGLDLPVGKL